MTATRKRRIAAREAVLAPARERSIATKQIVEVELGAEVFTYRCGLVVAYENREVYQRAVRAFAREDGRS